MERLARLRKRKGFSQRSLAQESGVSPATIYELENARREPNPSTLRKLATALGVEVADLFPEAAVPSPSLSSPRRGGFLEHIKTLDREALATLSNELDEQLARGGLSPTEYEDVQIKGLMVKMQMRVVANPDAKFEPVEVERKLTALAGAI